METINSGIDKEKMLFGIYRLRDLETQKERGHSISPESMALQARAIRAGKGDLFDAHKHPPQERTTMQTQESLAIIRGSMEARFFDIDDTPLGSTVLEEGDLLVTFAGGHEFIVLEEDTLIYEHKNGPYNGYEKDKELIDHA